MDIKNEETKELLECYQVLKDYLKYLSDLKKTLEKGDNNA